MTTTTESTATGTVYDFTVKSIDGKDVKLSQYKGKKLLIVNTASECGYTPQYKELEELYKKHGDKVVVLAFRPTISAARSPVLRRRLLLSARKTLASRSPCSARFR